MNIENSNTRKVKKKRMRTEGYLTLNIESLMLPLKIPCTNHNFILNE